MKVKYLIVVFVVAGVVGCGGGGNKGPCLITSNNGKVCGADAVAWCKSNPTAAALTDCVVIRIDALERDGTLK